MVVPTKAGQGNDPSSAPSSPRERGCGRACNGSNIPNCSNSHNGRSGPGQITPAHSLHTGHGTGDNGTGDNGQSNPGTSTKREATTNWQDPNSFQCFRCQGQGHMARECPTPVIALNQPWGNQGNAAHPPPMTATPANSRPCAFPPWPQTDQPAWWQPKEHASKELPQSFHS